MFNIVSSLVITVLNEEKTITRLLNSLESQSKIPDEIIIVDGGSTDQTKKVIEDFFKTSKLSKSSDITIIEKKGNRSVGRNTAVRKAQGDIILITDAGCILDSDWVDEVSKPFFTDKKVDVVAGYYRGEAKSPFTRSVVPYVLVMPDRVDPHSFLPATRSMAIRRDVYVSAGGLPEHLTHSEDYFFARKLKSSGKNIVFQKTAQVRWIPPESIKEVYTMFYNYAVSDIGAGILRPKVVVLFARYVIACIGFLLMICMGWYELLGVFLVGFILYSLWAIAKNYRYVKRFEAFVLLPFMQYLADCAVIHGTLKGVMVWATQKTR